MRGNRGRENATAPRRREGRKRTGAQVRGIARVEPICACRAWGGQAWEGAKKAGRSLPYDYD